jgi:hypothetical protein
VNTQTLILRAKENKQTTTTLHNTDKLPSKNQDADPRRSPLLNQPRILQTPGDIRATHKGRGGRIHCLHQELLLMDEEFVSRYNPDWASSILSLRSVAPITQGMKNLTIRPRGERQKALFGPDNNKEEQPTTSPTNQVSTTSAIQEQPTSQGHPPPQSSNTTTILSLSRTIQPRLHSTLPAIPASPTLISPTRHQTRHTETPTLNMPKPQFPSQFRQEQQHYPSQDEQPRIPSSSPQQESYLQI